MSGARLKDRYGAFCSDAERLLEEAGFADPREEPRIKGQAFYDACLSLATIHFPEDTKVNGHGPRGLLWGMYRSFEGHGDVDLIGARCRRTNTETHHQAPAGTAERTALQANAKCKSSPG